VSTVAIGDIHGDVGALDLVLGHVAPTLTGRDTVVFLGDYIDRGPESKACIDRILRFWTESRAQVVTLLGNHEEWMLKTLRDYSRHSWLISMEAFETIASYSAGAAHELRRAVEQAGVELVTGRVALPYELFFDAVPPAHLAFFEALVPYHRTAEAIYVHGGYDPRLGTLEDQPPSVLAWGPDGFPKSYGGSELVVYGHKDRAVVGDDGWPQPHVWHRTIGIDTSHHGVLTALTLPEARIVQARRCGAAPEIRVGSLPSDLAG
jgi:serine/threonine protein phosphatase 1